MWTAVALFSLPALADCWFSSVKADWHIEFDVWLDGQIVKLSQLTNKRVLIGTFRHSVAL